MGQNRLHQWWNITKAIWHRDWPAAADWLEFSHCYRTRVGEWLSSIVSRELARDALWQVRHSSFLHAWNHLQKAQFISPGFGAEWVRRRKNEVVEAAVARADAALVSGNLATSLGIVHDLSHHKILDWRADRIASAAQLIAQSERLVEAGKFNEALSKLALAARQRPDLHYLPQRIQHVAQTKREFLAALSDLKEALANEAFEQVAAIRQKLLALAPKGHDLIQATATSAALHPRLREPGATVPSVQAPNRFLLWIDGAGGFLVCRGAILGIGRHVEQSHVEIALQSDLLRRHAQLLATSDGYSLVGTPATRVNGKNCETPQALIHGDRIQLNSHVALQFLQRDWRSRTARLEFISGHRAVPWCDAILLMHDHVTIGPGDHHHIQIRGLRQEMVVRVRDGFLEVDSHDQPLRVDGREQGTVTRVFPDSRITTDQIAMQFETISVPDDPWSTEECG